jgi:septum formation inhibitor MinC
VGAYSGEVLLRLVYYAHSYRPIDDDVNEFFQELMVDEELTPSMDPPSDQLNAAKPERHLRSTDAMVVVLTQRDPAPSEYIRWEIGLGLRARRPQLVFVEDTLPDDLVPGRLLQRRFSRRHLLREARDHRQAVRMLKSYVGADPPPTYQPMSAQRRCVVIGGQRIGRESLLALSHCLTELRYKPVVVDGGRRLPDEMAAEEVVHRAALCVAVVEGLTPAEYYLLGAARAALTPSILITFNPAYVFNPVTPREYQPRIVSALDPAALAQTIRAEISIFEQDYLELVEEKQVHRYKQFRERVLHAQREEGHYTDDVREQIINYVQKQEIDMSRDKIQLGDVIGPVNIKSRLEQVTQTVTHAPGLQDWQRQDMATLIAELQAALATVVEKRPEDAERVTKTAELVVAEAVKAKPDKSFLSITVDGLTKAAQAVADIAPPVLSVAAKLAAFIAALP